MRTLYVHENVLKMTFAQLGKNLRPEFSVKSNLITAKFGKLKPLSFHRYSLNCRAIRRRDTLLLLWMEFKLRVSGTNKYEIKSIHVKAQLTIALLGRANRT